VRARAQGDQVEAVQGRGLPRFELRARFHHEAPAHRALAGAPTLDGRAERLQAPRVLPRRHADEHLLDDAPIERIGPGHRLKRREWHFAIRRPDPRALNGHLPTAEHDFARRGTGPTRRSIGLMGVPRATDRGAVFLEHRGEHAQPARTASSKSSVRVSTSRSTNGR
jgi:hypothetical protein